MAKKAKRRVKGLPVVAIVGRPNVGKSTLFNRLIGRHRAIVEDMPGVTRDRHYADADLGTRGVTYVDTGGFVPDGDGMAALAEQVRRQAEMAIEESQVVLFVVDGRAGRTVADEQVARALRGATQPVILVVNKVDRPQEAAGAAADFHRLGFSEIITVSAEHAYGTVDSEDAIVANTCRSSWKLKRKPSWRPDARRYDRSWAVWMSASFEMAFASTMMPFPISRSSRWPRNWMDL